jgi:hypothetical protein
LIDHPSEEGRKIRDRHFQLIDFVRKLNSPSADEDIAAFDKFVLKVSSPRSARQLSIGVKDTAPVRFDKPEVTTKATTTILLSDFILQYAILKQRKLEQHPPQIWNTGS